MLDPAVVRDLRFSLSDPLHLCNELGLLSGKFMRQAGGVIVRCPWHDEKSASCSVRVAKDGTIAAKCHGCGIGGDALSLIAAVHKLDIKADFRAVLEEAARLAGRTLDDPTPPPISRPPPPPERDYPPRDYVREFWDSCESASGDPEVAEWVKARGMNVNHVDGSEVARSIPKRGDLPIWAKFQGKSWRETGHKLIVPMFDHAGDLRSVRACRVIAGDSPKRLPPGGYRASGLVMACTLAQAMLKGTWIPQRLVIVEGEPDFLIWSSRTGIAAHARIGLTSGGWTSEIAAKVPVGCEVSLRTDHDEAGERYAREVAATLPKCTLRRPRAS